MRINRTAIVKNFIIILVLIYSIMPVVSRFVSSTISTYFYMVLLVVLAVYIVLVERGYSLGRSVVVLAPFILWRLLEFWVTPETTIMWGYQSLLGVMPIILGIYILQYRQYEHRFFCKLICIAFIITMVTTINGLIEYPEAARWLATVESPNDAMLITYEWKNIGGFNFVYSVVLLYPLIIAAYKQKRINTIWTVCLTGGIFWLLIYAEYTTALLLFLVSSTLFFVSRELKGKDVLVLIIIAILLCVVFSDAVSQVLIWFGDHLNSENFSQRLYALAGDTTGDTVAMDAREGAYLISVNTFLSHPFLGTFLQGGHGSGGHSFILDIFARFGLLGATVLVFMYKRVYEVFYRPLKGEKGYGFVLWVFIQAIILSCINTGMWLYVIALYAPLLVHVIYGER